MGFDVHIGEHYLVVGHVPMVVLMLLPLGALLCACALGRFIWRRFRHEHLPFADVSRGSAAASTTPLD